MLAAASVAHAAQGEHEHKALTGPLAHATVGFGAWPVGTVQVPRDRFTLPNAPQGPNVHALLPNDVTIKEGGSVSFVLAGFHHVTHGDCHTAVLQVVIPSFVRAAMI